MTSNFACIGLGVGSNAELFELLNALLPLSERVSTSDSLDIYRWQDPSGARVVLGVRGNELDYLLPSFAGRPGVRLADCHRLNDEVVSAAVVDPAGEQITAMAFELEQRGALVGEQPWSGEASVVAFGPEVDVFSSVEEFAASPASLLVRNPEAAQDDGTPPVRVGADSFISYGVFGDPGAAESYARLSGTVLAAEERRNDLTGHAFTACRVRCLDFEVDVLLDSDVRRTPSVGELVAGTVYLVGAIEELGFAPAGTRLRGFRRAH